MNNLRMFSWRDFKDIPFCNKPIKMPDENRINCYGDR